MVGGVVAAANERCPTRTRDGRRCPRGLPPDSSANRDDENSDGRVEAELNPSSTASLSTSLRADYIPAVLEWDGGDNEKSSGHHHHVGESAYNPAALLLSYDSSSKTLLFRLRIIITLRGSSSSPWKAKAPVYLCIHPASLHRLAHHATEQPPAQYTGRLGNELISLRVELLSAAGLTVPDWPLAAQSPTHGRVLDAAKLLALQRTFTVYIQPSRTLSPANLDMLCAAVARRELQTSPASGDPRTLFEGRRHTSLRVIGRDEIAGAPAPATRHVETLSGVPATGDGQDDTSFPPSPPPYNAIDPPPPMAPLEHAPKRKRRSSSSLDAGTGSSAALAEVESKLGISVEKICRKIVADELSHAQQRIDRLEHRLAQVGRERDDAVRLVEELRQELRQELRNAVDRLDERLDDKIEDRVWLEVDELRTSLHMDMDELQGDMKSEMRDYVQEQVEEQIGEQADRAAEEVHTRLASAQVNILERRLEIQYQNG